MSESKGPDDGGPAADVGGAIRAEFDWSEVPPSTAVVETVAIAADREPTGLEPLYEAVDPDSLDALFRSRGADTRDGDTTVTFALDGHEVSVRSDGSVVVRPVTARADIE